MNATVTNRMIVAAQTGESDDYAALLADLEAATGRTHTRRLVESDTQGVAAEAIMGALDGAAHAIAWDRVFKAPGQDETREELLQSARAAVWSAVTTWDVEAENTAEFTSYAIQTAKLDAQAAMFAEAAPGVAVDAAARYAGALRRNGGDHDSAVAEMTTLEDTKRRMSPDYAEQIRAAFEGPAYINAGGDTERSASLLDAADESTPDKWAERQGELQPSLRFNPLEISRDAVKVRGISTTGKGAQKGEKARDRATDGRAYAVSVRKVGEPYERPDSVGEFVKAAPLGQGKGNGWKENGAVIDRDAEADTHARYVGAAQVKAAQILALFTPAERAVVEAAAGVDGGFTAAGRVSAAKVAEATGKAQNTVKKTAQRINKRLDAARANGEI